MTYRAGHELIDPEVKPRFKDFEKERDDETVAPDDSYVIEEGGSTAHAFIIHSGKRARKGRKRWAKPAAFVLGALFIVLTVWNLSRFLQGPPPPPKPSPFQVKQALYLGVMKIDAYRRVHGLTPDSLAGAGLPEAGPYAYRRIDSTHYVLSYRGNGSQLEYDSNEPKNQFFGSPQDILTIGGPQ